MRLEHHLVGGYVRYISPHIIIILLLLIRKHWATIQIHVNIDPWELACYTYVHYKFPKGTKHNSRRLPVMLMFEGVVYRMSHDIGHIDQGT